MRPDPTPSLTAIPPTATATSTLTHTATATTTSTPKLAATPTPSTRQQAHTFTAQIASEDHMTRTVRLNYLLYLPKDTRATPQAKWPLILFLHGAGERGDNLNLVKKEGLPKIVDQREDFPFIVVSPQCPSSSWWSDETDALNALLDNIVTTYAVDLNRIYVTGLSMGGYGTWRLALEHPDSVRRNRTDRRRLQSVHP